MNIEAIKEQLPYFIEGRAKGQAEGEARGLSQGLTQGMAQGKAEALLMVLGARGLAVTEEERQRILSEAEVTKLERWLTLALKVTQVSELWAASAKTER